MRITWFGHSCFKLTETNMATVVTDPYDYQVVGYQPLSFQAQIVTVGYDSPEHNHIAAISGEPFIIDGPGEFEVGNVFITGIHTANKDKQNDNKRNTIYVFNYNGAAIVHLGRMNRVPNRAEVEDIGDVHVALVPVGGGDSLNASSAAEIISLLEPAYVIPMQYATSETKLSLDPINQFLKEMGLTEVETIPYLDVNTTFSTQANETRVIVLDYPENEKEERR